MSNHLPDMSQCPVCGSRPEIDQVQPWPRGMGPRPWYAICYKTGEHEHCVGVNAYSQREVMEKWNAEVVGYSSLIEEPKE